MSNKRLYQFLFSKQPKLTMINGIITFGSTGAVSSASGPGVYGVTRLGTGLYQVKLQDNYNAINGFKWCAFGGVTGSSVAGGAFVTGTLYQILTLGTTTTAQWQAAGLDSDFTPAVGQVFVALGAGAGSGTVKAIGHSGIFSVEMAQSQSGQLANNNSYSGKGSAFIIQTYNASAALANPASGSQLQLDLWFRDSSVTPY